MPPTHSEKQDEEIQRGWILLQFFFNLKMTSGEWEFRTKHKFQRKWAHNQQVCNRSGGTGYLPGFMKDCFLDSHHGPSCVEKNVRASLQDTQFSATQNHGERSHKQLSCVG